MVVCVMCVMCVCVCVCVCVVCVCACVCVCVCAFLFSFSKKYMTLQWKEIQRAQLLESSRDRQSALQF
jgi:hypothetical protein